MIKRIIELIAGRKEEGSKEEGIISIQKRQEENIKLNEARIEAIQQRQDLKREKDIQLIKSAYPMDLIYMNEKGSSYAQISKDNVSYLIKVKSDDMGKLKVKAYKSENNNSKIINIKDKYPDFYESIKERAAYDMLKGGFLYDNLI